MVHKMPKSGGMQIQTPRTQLTQSDRPPSVSLREHGGEAGEEAASCGAAGREPLTVSTQKSVQGLETKTRATFDPASNA